MNSGIQTRNLQRRLSTIRTAATATLNFCLNWYSRRSSRSKTFFSMQQKTSVHSWDKKIRRRKKILRKKTWQWRWPLRQRRSRQEKWN